MKTGSILRDYQWGKVAKENKINTSVITQIEVFISQNYPKKIQYATIFSIKTNKKVLIMSYREHHWLRELQKDK